MNQGFSFSNTDVRAKYYSLLISLFIFLLVFFILLNVITDKDFNKKSVTHDSIVKSFNNNFILEKADVVEKLLKILPKNTEFEVKDRSNLSYIAFSLSNEIFFNTEKADILEKGISTIKNILSALPNNISEFSILIGIQNQSDFDFNTMINIQRLQKIEDLVINQSSITNNSFGFSVGDLDNIKFIVKY